MVVLSVPNACAMLTNALLAPVSWSITEHVFYATMLFPTALHLNLLRLPPDDLITSLPQDVVSLMPPTLAVRPSWYPTSRPMTYPAPKPTTDTSTTTPALTTQVRSVGEMRASSPAAVFFFFVARGVRPAETLRLDLSEAQPLEEDLGVDLSLLGGDGN
jgi:hypothetical protein